MSDGPHKSLNMPRSWKKLAERADKRSYAAEEVREALPSALMRDWRAEVSESFCRQVQTILCDTQSSLFDDQKITKLEALRIQTAGYPLGNVFLDYAVRSAHKNGSANDALMEAVCNTLKDRALRGARQIEEHYRRESTDNRAIRVRQRIEQGIEASNIVLIANRLITTEKSGAQLRVKKRTGLDDGVQL
jgi:hypothetical protein